MIEVRPIGTVRSPVTEVSQGHWGDIESELHFDPVYAPGLQGLEGFSHVVVMFYLHRVQGFDPDTQLLRAPRGMEDLGEIGVFAQRTRFRPNPIGVTAVKLLGVQGNVVRVRGLDAIDETPVLDLKPYMPPFDRVDDVTLPPWFDRFIAGYF